eukprot:CAMPEP_0194281108 /NCGR_PEP_ID=MMETSP0169-20130528/19883_1 /TAXON_ID=218684 /ORGANISM="Corethron pennatum, Strain L29A3" /LENGTH=90 /DNA_ID=CAMNT_0039026075 /DNA_START=32 /DNA_END=304 /DNA_ORIENTATION=-
MTNDPSEVCPWTRIRFSLSKEDTNSEMNLSSAGSPSDVIVPKYCFTATEVSFHEICRVIPLAPLPRTTPFSTSFSVDLRRAELILTYRNV